jgi:glycosyltransferase involved in cell wall biosynthesis
MPDLVSIVIPTFRRPVFLDEALARLAAMRRPVPFELIVVDDGSEDDTPDVVQRYQGSFPSLRYLHQENGGAGKARNNGARNAKGDLLLFTDDDILVAPDHLEAHLAAHEKYGENTIVSGHWELAPRVVELLNLTPFGRFRLEMERWYREASMQLEPLGDGRFRPSAMVSWNFSLARELFNRLGGFNETIAHAGLEDQEMSLRAKQAGCTLIYDHNIKLLQNEPFVTLDSFCERRRTGAYDTVCAAIVRTDGFASRDIITANLAPKLGEPPQRLLKKLVRSGLATNSGERGLRALIALLERFSPRSAALGKAYWVLSGSYIMRGVRQAVSETGWVPPA